MTDYEHIAIDLTDAAGSVLLRSGVVVTYFLNDAHASHAMLVKAAMEDFALRFMGRGAIYFPGDEAYGETRAEDVSALLDEQIIRPLQPPKFALLDSPLHAPRFSATYCGMDREHLASLDWPNAVCGLRFIFSLPEMGEEGLSDIVEFARHWANVLPLASGHIAPAFVVREGIDENVAMTTVARLCRRYRCMDISALLLDCFEVGVGVKGAYWCNFIGVKALADAGGEARLRQACAGTDSLLESLDAGSVLLVLGQLPIFGDVNRRQDLGLYRWAFDLLEPAMRPRTVPYLGFDEESMQAWVMRFVGGDS